MTDPDLGVAMTIALVVVVVIIICCVGWLITWDQKKLSADDRWLRELDKKKPDDE